MIAELNGPLVSHFGTVNRIKTGTQFGPSPKTRPGAWSQFESRRHEEGSGCRVNIAPLGFEGAWLGNNGINIETPAQAWSRRPLARTAKVDLA